MMNSKELKKKIEDILEEYNFETDNGWILDTEEMADDLIASGIGDLKDLQAQVDALEITNIALQAGYQDAEKDRLYWVNKYKGAEHRAEIAEKALNSACFILAKNYYTDGKEDWAKRGTECATFYREQAERELAEDRKDE